MLRIVSVVCPLTVHRTQGLTVVTLVKLIVLTIAVILSILFLGRFLF